MQPHVFVAMPFGRKEARSAAPADAGAPAVPAVVVDFDLVYERLIAPALKRAGCVPFRADEETSAGDIRTDMFFELVTADVVVADISVLNANVFYELGVRHGVAPRGVVMVHGGWTKAPFDIASDRRFQYDGTLFSGDVQQDDDAWKGRVQAEAERLGQVFTRALEADAQAIGSPVYKEVVGLRPVDWSGVRTARAQYFGEVFADWKARVDLAKLNGWPGDILTLADDAPTRFHRAKLLWHAADALCSMHRFEAALPVLKDLLALDPRHREGLTRMGLVLGRLGRINEARVHMLRVAEDLKDDTEAHGILGRVYKDLWRLEWKDLESLQERQAQAVATSSYVASAVRSYDRAARRRFDYYTGINVVSFVTLLAHLKQATGDEPADCKVDDLETLAAVVRFAAQNTLESAGLDAGQDGVWAAATLGELELVAGRGEKARAHYRAAAAAPETTYFNVSSMLEQVCLFESLGFQPDAVAGVKAILEGRRSVLESRIGGLKRSEPRFGKVAIASGHMIDTPTRADERFPARKEGVVRERIAAQLATWAIGAGDLAICGGARGADMLFAELCAERQAEVWLMLALPEAEFLEASVRLPDSDWEDRFFRLRGHPQVKTFVQRDRLQAPPKGTSVYARNNLWMVNTARVEVRDAVHLHALLVWDEKVTGDGPGGTADCAARVKTLGGRTAIVNPTRV
jgi:tetratricopeptide (TPR) repeat protein